ncbi:MAG TPA: ATP12 family protein [Xanthobacteraceae bacterium]|nr:ATP12 family protein [Xanthobacteraceae bacterium]
MSGEPDPPEIDPVASARGPARARIRRFYKQAAVAETDDGFEVQLDQRPVRTPGRTRLAVPNRPLAEALAAEWDGQGEWVEPMEMPLTRLVNSALDGVAHAPGPVADEIVSYAGSDLLCYRAESPAALVERQCAVWDPVLDWAHAALGARFVLVEGVRFAAQPPGSLAAIAAALPDDPLRLAALNTLTTLSGSALLALAAWRGALSASEAWRAAHLDEDFQAEIWGRDSEAEQRRAAHERQFNAALTLLRLAD